MLDWLFNFISSFFGILWDGILWAIEGLLELLGYMLFLIFDGILTVIYLFMEAIDFSEVAFNYASTYSNLPPLALYVASAIDIPQYFTYVSIALGIRLTLNIIPAAVTRI